jgi:CRISPR system Cascade subunit CasA
MYCGIIDEFSDSLELHASLLADLGIVWQKHILDEIERCDQLAKVVGRLGMNLDRAMGGSDNSAGDAEKRAKERAYYRLDIPFRQWLLLVNPEQELEQQNEYRKNWRDISRNIIRNLGQELVSQAGTAAIVGRTVTEEIKNKKNVYHYSAPEAFNYFLYQLNKIDS